MSDARVQLQLGYIGANVRRLRLRLGLTQEQLAESADMELSFFQRVERARTNLSVAVLVRLADALSVRPAVLLRPAKLLPPARGRPPRAGTSAPRRRPVR